MKDVCENAPYQRYLDGLERGALVYQLCAECDNAVFYLRPGCPFCGSLALELRDSCGRGTIYSATVIYDRTQNYNLVLIDLEEGFRMMSTLPGCENPGIGAQVQARVERLEGGTPRVVFDLQEGAQ